MRTRTAIILLYLAAAAWGTWSAFRPTIESGFDRLQTDPGDTVLNHYILEHSLRCLTDSDYPGRLWSPPMYYPEPWTLTYSENLLGAAPFYWLLRVFFEPLPAYQLWMMLMLLLDFAALAWVLRKLGRWHVFAVLGAYLFAFGLPYVVQMGHQQLLPRMFMPLAVYFMWRHLTEPGVRNLISLLACWYLQLLCGIYLAWFLSFGLGVMALCCFVVDFGTIPRLWRAFRARWLTVLIALGITAGLAALILVPYQMVNQHFRRFWWEVLQYSPRPASWINAPPGAFWHDILKPITGEGHHERWLFIGFGFWVLVVLGVVGAVRAGALPIRREILVFLTSALVIGLLATVWPGDVTAWRVVYEYVPGAKAIRALARIFMVVDLLALIGATAGAQMLFERMSRPALRAALASLLLLVCVAEQSVWDPPSYPTERTYGRIGPLAQRMRDADADAVHVAPDPKEFWVDEEVITMWAGLEANVPVVDGYTGRSPDAYPNWFEPLTDEELRDWFGYHGWKGRVAVLEADGSVRYIQIE